LLFDVELKDIDKER